MFRTSSIRNTVAVVVAMASVAVATGPVAPTAHATKNDGRYKKSGEAKRKKMKLCNDLETSFDNWLTVADFEAEQGNSANWNQAIDNAQKTHQNAKNAGCGWAKQRTTPTQMPGRDADASTGDAIVTASPGS